MKLEQEVATLDVPLPPDQLLPAYNESANPAREDAGSVTSAAPDAAAPQQAAVEDARATVAGLVRDGIAHAKSGNLLLARMTLQEAVYLDKQHETALMWLASISDKPIDLLGYLQEVLLVNPSNERAAQWAKSTKAMLAKSLIQQGAASHREGMPEIAEQYFLQAAEYEPSNETAWLWLVSVASEPEDKLSYLNRILQLNPAHEKALALFHRTKTQIARQLVKKGYQALDAGDTDGALEILRDVMDYNPNLEEAWLLKASLCESPQEKIGCFSKVLELNPDSELAQQNLLALRIEQQQAEQASRLAAEAQSEEPSFDEAAAENEFDQPQFAAVESELFSEKSDEHIEENADQNAAESSVENVAENFGEYFGEYFQENSPERIAESSEEQFVRAASENQSEIYGEHQHENHSENSLEYPSEFSSEAAAEDSSEAVSENQMSAEENQMLAESANFAASEVAEKQEFVGDKYVEVGDLSENSIVAELGAADNAETLITKVCEHSDFAVSDQDFQAAENVETMFAADTVLVHAEPETLVACQFCQGDNVVSDFRCVGCGAFFRLGNFETLLGNEMNDESRVREYIEQCSGRELSACESFDLGLAYLNLHNAKKAVGHFENVLRLEVEDETHGRQIADLFDYLKEKMPEIFGTAIGTSGKTIMVVDDSPTVRKLIVSKLEKHGHAVVAAVDGMDALSKINEAAPDLILLDVTMPRLDGYQLCKLVKANSKTKHIPVVMISGKDGFFDKVRGRMAGSTAYITKPFGPETLLHTVETYCK